MSHVMYDGKRLIPAPFVSIQKQFNTTQDGTVIGKEYTISVRGTLVAFMGSPDSNGDFWTVGGYPPDESITTDSRLASMLRKQEALRELFSVHGKTFEVQSADGSQPLKCNPRIESIDIPDGIWYDKLEYTITLKADRLYPELDSSTDTPPYIADFQESWSIETNEDSLEVYDENRTYALRHSVSAKGKKFYDETGTITSEPWELAKEYVLTKLGFNIQMAITAGVNELDTDYRGWNLVRTEDIDKTSGSYSVTENWVLAKNTATEVFSISKETSLDSPYTSVSIEGTVQGFEERGDDALAITTKWDNALSKYTSVSTLAFNRAQDFSGVTLNTEPLNTAEGRNPITGLITYSRSYDNRPIKLIPGVKSEAISINDNNRGDVFASIFCIGREQGPILQYLGAQTEATRTLNVELVVEPASFSDRTVSTIKTLMNQNPRLNPTYSGYIQNVIDAANPENNGYETSLRSQPQESWDFLLGRYSYNVTWTYE